MTTAPRTALLAAALLACAPAARAQMAVFDAAGYAKLIQQAQTAASQLAQLQQQVGQGRTLLASLSPVSNVDNLATTLNAPAVRSVVPDANAFLAAARGDFAALGQIGQQAQAIRQTNRLYTPPPGDPIGADLEAAGDRAARDLATAEAIGSAGATRLQGLQTLQAAVGDAPNVRAVLDLQARLAAEQAMNANDQMRLQAVAMSQAAEARLAQQQQAERAAAARDARLAMYQAAFQ